MTVQVEYDYELSISPDCSIIIPKVLKLTNFEGVKEPYYIYCYPPKKTISHSVYSKTTTILFKEGDLIKFGPAPGDVGQILLISSDMNLIEVQVGIERGRRVRFSFKYFSENPKIKLIATKEELNQY